MAALRRVAPVFRTLIVAVFKDLALTDSLRKFLMILNTIARRGKTGLKFPEPLDEQELKQRALKYHSKFALIMIYAQVCPCMLSTAWSLSSRSKDAVSALAARCRWRSAVAPLAVAYLAASCRRSCTACLLMAGHPTTTFVHAWSSLWQVSSRLGASMWRATRRNAQHSAT